MSSSLPSGYMVLCTSQGRLTQLILSSVQAKKLFKTSSHCLHLEHADQFVFRNINHIPLGILENKLFLSEYTLWNIRHDAA